MEKYASWLLLLAAVMAVVAAVFLYRFLRARSARLAEPESPPSYAEDEDLDSSHIAFRPPLPPQRDGKPRA
ncbi:MAG: hypothetical protein U1F15_09150 [Burkholderiales bacterium]